MKNIAIYCGSSSGNEKIFIESAYSLGKVLAKKGYSIIYGGACVGLMGAVADGALSQQGKVIGVIPKFLKEKELEHIGLSEIHIVETMHERKALMNELCDGAIALPGGFGTMDELFEMLTWAQLSLHKKAISILNIDGYYNALIELCEKMIEKGFLKKEYSEMLIIDSNIDRLLNKMETYCPPINDKWFITN